MKLHQLPKTITRRKKRVGRGYGSGKGGHTTGRGQKGQKARGKVKAGFEGGQLPLAKRLPRKKGFKGRRRKKAVINLSQLGNLKAETLVTPKSLVKEGVLKSISKEGVKILGKGKVKASLKFKGIEVSLRARGKIREAGGEVLE